MADRSGLRLVGFIFASVTFAVMLTAAMVVKGYSDGVYSLESTPRSNALVNMDYLRQICLTLNRPDEIC